MGSFELAERLEDCKLTIVFYPFVPLLACLPVSFPLHYIILPGAWACA